MIFIECRDCIYYKSKNEYNEVEKMHGGDIGLCKYNPKTVILMDLCGCGQFIDKKTLLTFFELHGMEL